MKGKITSQRVLDVEGPIMETSVSCNGTVRDTEVTKNVTFVGRPSSNGVLWGEGKGIIMSKEGEVVTFAGQGFGTMKSSDIVSWRGTNFYRTTSTGRLAFLKWRRLKWRLILLEMF